MNVIYVVSSIGVCMHPLGFAANEEEAERAIEELVRWCGFSREDLYITKYEVKKEYQEFEE